MCGSVIPGVYDSGLQSLRLLPEPTGMSSHLRVLPFASRWVSCLKISTFVSTLCAVCEKLAMSPGPNGNAHARKAATPTRTSLSVLWPWRRQVSFLVVCTLTFAVTLKRQQFCNFVFIFFEEPGRQMELQRMASEHYYVRKLIIGTLNDVTLGSSEIFAESCRTCE